MKKTNQLILIAFLFAIGSQNFYSQILNNSFESWDSGMPSDWISINILTTGVAQTSDAYHGSSAIQMEIANYLNVPFPALLQTYGDNGNSVGHPVSAKYGTFKGYFKLDLKGSAQFGGSIVMHDETEQPIGTGGFNLSNSSADWIPIEVPIEYFNDKVPSFVSITFFLADTSEGDQSTIGSTVKIDLLTLDTATDVELNGNAPLVYSLNQNYPNPFNPSTTIKYSVGEQANNDFQNVNLIVYDILGSKVATLVNETQKTGNYEVNFDASNIPSGVYFYRIQAGKFVDTKKMILLR